MRSALLWWPTDTARVSYAPTSMEKARTNWRLNKSSGGRPDAERSAASRRRWSCARRRACQLRRARTLCSLSVGGVKFAGSGTGVASVRYGAAPHNKLLQPTVIPNRMRAASAPFHCAHAARWTRGHAAAELRRYVACFKEHQNMASPSHLRAKQLRCRGAMTA